MSSSTSNSRLEDVPIVRHDPVNNQSASPDWNSASYLKIADITAYSEYVIKNVDAHRPDLLSYKLYGTVDYWWVFGIYNALANPMHDLKEGLKIKYPSLSSLQQAMSIGRTEKEALGPLSSGGDNVPTAKSTITIE